MTTEINVPLSSRAVTCPVCRSDASAVVFEQVGDYLTGARFDVRRCASCEVAFTCPQPHSMHPFYPPFYRRYGRGAHAVLKLLYHRRARSWVRALGTSGTALDIGCGDGWMLRALRQQGWTVVGNERMAQNSAFASTVRGLPVFIGALDALKPQSRFALIILFQVLEHLADPVGTLQQCIRLLKPDGTLIVSVPNLESWQARVAGRLWFHLDVPRHLFHFSARSLSSTLELAGFEVIATGCVSFEHDPYGWVQSLQNWLGFKQNILTKYLMGAESRSGVSPGGIAIYLLALCLLVPSLVLALCSWLARAGAVIELRARKTAAFCSAPLELHDNKNGALDRSFYDEIWVAWRDMQRYAPAPRYLRRMVMKELARLEFQSVLDMGCGEGTLLKMIAEAYPRLEIAGSELSETALRYCREQVPQVKIFRLDIEHDDVAGISYDLIVSVQVLEHLKDDMTALRKLRSMCRKYVLISVPGGELDEHACRVGHYRHYTRDSLARKMERAGFTVIRSFACGWPVHSLFYRQLVRHLPKKAVEQVGLGAYGWKKRRIMQLMDMAYRCNLSFIGTEIFAIGVPR